MRIFLSYGHDDYSSLAWRIKRDLEALGHEVWFDVERLKSGGDWERYIEEGFEFASKENETGRFLLLMTPHWVRRPDGYCLNELARAYGRSLPVIPVMVSTIEPPLSICRLQWLDMRHCFPAEQYMWELETGRELRTLEGHSDSVKGVAVTPDAKRVVSASGDQMLKVWDVETGEALATFICDSKARCCVFSDVLQLVVAGDAGGRVHFLHLRRLLSSDAPLL